MAFVGSVIAFLCGWVPFLGVGLGVIVLVVAIIAVRRPVLRGLAVAGIVLSALASAASAVTTSLTVLAVLASSGSPGSTPSEVMYAPEDFVDVDERTLADIAKDPDAHVGETIVVYGYVTQFDANTGPCTMRVSISATPQRSWLDYEHNSMAFSGDGDSECPELDDVIADDEVKMSVVIRGGESYSSLGGYQTVPHLEVIDAEVL